MTALVGLDPSPFRAACCAAARVVAELGLAFARMGEQVRAALGRLPRVHTPEQLRGMARAARRARRADRRRLALLLRQARQA